MSDVDVAYGILQQRDKDDTMHYKELILEVIDRQKKPVRNLDNPEAEIISEIYTQINMDSRFAYVKDGNWGLSEWYLDAKKSRGSKSDDSKSEDDN